jgi:hypothetical protein
MSTNTKLMLLGLVVCTILGIILQGTIASKLQRDMGVGAGDELLTPDEAAKKLKKEAIKNQKKLEDAKKDAAGAAK